MALTADIVEVNQCCNNLECDSSVERRKNVEKLKILLEKDSVQKWFETKGRSNKSINYTLVFKSVQGYLFKETQFVRNITAGNILDNSSEQKLKILVNYLHFVVKVANKNFPCIKCSEFIVSIVTILKTTFYCQYFGLIYLELLESDVLVYDSYVQNIMSINYEELICACVHFLKFSLKKHYYCIKILSAIKILFKCIFVQCAAHCHSYFFDYIKETSEILKLSTSTMVEHYLWILFHYSNWQVDVFPDLVCDLADTTLPMVIPLLLQSKLNEDGQACALQYCLLQVKLHLCIDTTHPVICVSQMDFDQNRWIVLVKEMFSILYKKIISLKFSHQNSREGASTYPFHTEQFFTNLMALLLHICLKENISFPESSEPCLFSYLPSTDNDIWVVVCKLFSSSYNNSVLSQIIWADAIKILVAKFPNDLNSTNINLTIGSVCKLLASLNSAILKSSLSLLIELLQAYFLNKSICQLNVVLWSQLWENAKCHAFKTANIELSALSFKVMSFLLQYAIDNKFVSDKQCNFKLNDIWQPLSLCMKSISSLISFLLAFINATSCYTENFCLNDTFREAHCSIRINILKWLFGFKEVEDTLEPTFHISNHNDTKFPSKNVPNLFNDIELGSMPEVELTGQLVVSLCCFHNNQDFKISEKVYHCEKTYINVIQLEVVKLSSTFLQTIDKSLNSAVDCKLTIIYQALYSVILVCYASLSLGEGFCFNNQYSYPILTNVIKMLLTCVEDGKALLILNHPIIFDNFLKLITLVQNNFVSKEIKSILGDLSTLLLALFEWFLNYCQNQKDNNSLSSNQTDVVVSNFENISTGNKRGTLNNCESTCPSKRFCYDLDQLPTASCSSDGDKKISHETMFGSFNMLLLLYKELYLLKINGLDFSMLFSLNFFSKRLSMLNSFHARFFIAYVKVLSDSDKIFKSKDLPIIVSMLKDVLKLHFRNQELFTACLKIMPVTMKYLSACLEEENLKESLCFMISRLEIIEKLITGNQCSDKVVISFINCLAQISPECIGYDLLNTNFNKYTIITKSLNFLLSDNLMLVKECATASSILLKCDDVVCQPSFTHKLLLHFKKIEEQLLNILISLKSQSCKKLYYAYYFLKTFWNALPFSGHVIEPCIVFESCCFFSKTCCYFTPERSKTLQCILNSLVCDELLKRLPNSSLCSHLEDVLWKWKNIENLDNFPFYFFGFSSMSSFLHETMDVVLPIRLLKSLIHKSNYDSMIAFFQNSDLRISIVNFIGLFLLKFYEQDKLFRSITFENVKPIMVRLHKCSKSSTSLSNIIQNGLPVLFVLCLKHFCPDDRWVSTMKVALDESALKSLLSVVFELSKTGKFNQNCKIIDINAIFNFFQSHSYAVHSVVLHLRHLLQSTDLIEQQRLVAVHKYIISSLEQSSCHVTQMFLKLTVFTLCKQIYFIANCFLHVISLHEVQQLAETLICYLNLIHWLQNQESQIKSSIFSDNDVAFNISCVSVYAAKAGIKQKSALVEYEKLCEVLEKIVMSLLQCGCQMNLHIFILHSSSDLKLICKQEILFQPLFSQKDFSQLLFDMLLRISDLHIIIPDINSLIIDMLKHFGAMVRHKPIWLNMNEFKELFEAFYSFYKNKVDLQIVSAFLECVQHFHLNKVEDKNSAKKETNIFDMLLNGVGAICNICMKEEFATAMVAHSCLLHLMQYHTFNIFLEKMYEDSNKHNLTYQFLKLYKKIPESDAANFFSNVSLVSEKNPNLWSCDQTNFKEWLCNVTGFLIDLCEIDFLYCMKDISKLSASVSYFILPFIFFNLFVGKTKPIAEDFINNILSTALNLSTKSKNKEVLAFSLQIIKFIRIEYQAMQNGERRNFPLCKIINKKIRSENLVLNINPLFIAEVALMCNDPTTALFYLEIWSETVISNNKSTSFSTLLHNQTNICPFALLHQNGVLENKIGELAIAAFAMLNETDSVYGCCSILPHITDFSKLFESQGNWIKAIQANDVKSSEKRYTEENIVKCLQESGFKHVSNVYAKHANNELFNCNLEELCFKSTWQSCQWDKEMFAASTNKASAGFHKQFFNHLVNLHRQHSCNFSHSHAKLNSLCLDSFASNGKVFNLNNFNHMLIQLHCLKATKIVRELFENNSNLDDIVKTWKQLRDFNCITFNTFKDASLFFSAHTSLLHMIADKHRTSDNKKHGIINSKILELLALNHLQSFNVFCQFEKFQHSRHILYRLTELVKNMNNPSDVLEQTTDWWNGQIILNKAVLLWEQQEKTFAASMLKNFLKNFKHPFGKKKYDSSELLLLAKVLRTIGIWMNESKFEGALIILHDYLEKSVNLLEEHFSSSKEFVEDLSKSYFALAKFADQQLQEILLYKSSQEYGHKFKLASETFEIKQNEPTLSKRTSTIIDKSNHIDKQELFDVRKNELNFLLSAVKSYMRCLELSNLHNLYLHRICSLWFYYKLESSVNEYISNNHVKILSYKYVSLAYQMAARLNKADPLTDYAHLLKTILSRVAADHPHHILPILLALLSSCATKETKTLKKSACDQTKIFNNNAISSIVNATSLKWKKLVSAMKGLTQAYSEFANFDVSQYRNHPQEKIAFARSLFISHLCDAKSRHCLELNRVVIPVCNLPLNPTASYSKIPENLLFSHFKQNFQTCGGVNLPKVVVAASLSGALIKHLVKGKDDLRQDAVMQQVFEMVNLLLQKSSLDKNLKMRSYKVIPLTSQTGLVEWCEGTIPIGFYLTGNLIQKVAGAHERLRPQDMPVLACRKKLASAAQYTVNKKLEVYQGICSKLLPVFRYFFVENFLTSSEWFYSKRNYTQSVAVSSIIGYIIGLGDRHVQNILLDKQNAEVIHIDLGVAFEQGRYLPTPETVPFRLTRDIIDGMGFTGVEGLFRKQCEQILSLLRSSFDVIIPILEVMLYDPMHDWTIPHNKSASPVTKQFCSGNINLSNTGSCERTNELAERALLRVKEKLKGIENGSPLSVSGQVNLLICQATDPVRLCQLFHGWQPYL